MPITSAVSPSILLVDERPSGDNTTTKFVLTAPPPARRRRQRASSTANQATRCAPNPPACPPRPAPNRRRSSTCSRVVSPRSPFSSFLSVLDPPSDTRVPRKSSAHEIGLGFPTTRLSPTVVNTILAIASGKSHRRSLSGPVLSTALSFETHFEPKAPAKPVPSPTPSYTSPRYILFQRTCALAALGGVPSAIPSTPKTKPKTKARPTPIMTSNKNGHVNVLLMPKHRDGGAASVRSKSSTSTSASKSKSRKVTESSTISSRTTKGSDPALRAQRSLTPARGVAHDAFRPLPYATHAALDEFFGDPRKMNALHAHQSSSKQLGARPDEVGYGNSVGHQGADGWIWFDAIEEQEYAWLMAEGDSPNTPHTARQPPKEKKSKKRGLFGRRNSAASESSGGRSDWESFDALRRGSESGTSDGEFIDPTTYDLDPTLPPRYRTGVTDSTSKFKVATLDAGAWDATVHSRFRQTGTSAPKTRRGRSRRGSSNKANQDEERRRPPPLNLAAVTHTLAALGPVAPPAVAPAPPSRRPSLPANYLFPPSLADVARADFVSSSYQPHPSKRDLNLDPETPWSANLPHETIYRSIGSDLVAPGATPGSPFKAIFARRGSLTPLPLRHTPVPLPRAGQPYEFKGTGATDALPKLPPMPMENGAPAPAEGKRKTSLADIFRRGFGGKGNRK